MAGGVAMPVGSNMKVPDQYVRRTEATLPDKVITALRTEKCAVFLDTARVLPDEHRSYLFTDPVMEITAYRPEDTVKIYRQIEKALARGLYVAGWWGYEWGYALMPRLTPLLHRHRPHGPLVWLGIFENPLVWDPAEKLPETGKSTGRGDCNPCRVSEPELDTDRHEFGKAVRTIKKYIRQGDTYQVNYTIRSNFSYIGDPVDMYRQLRSEQQVSYGAVIRNHSRWILSLSPELFFHRQGMRIWSKPMKGTVHRGSSPDEDRQLAEFLRHDSKNRAENVMIVDLLRNDLGRIAATGSVSVPELFKIEEYGTLFQMISRIEARLRSNTRWKDIFKALFPCGSITGAPKIRTMEIISEIETSPRNIYTGSIGFISPDNEAVLNVAIRTIELDGTKGVMGIGSGITIGSDPDSEYEETVLKSLFLRQAMNGQFEKA